MLHYMTYNGTCKRNRLNLFTRCLAGVVSVIVVLMLSGCGSEKTLSESSVLHIVEIPHPHDVTSIYGDQWPNVVGSYVRDDEYTVVLVANHAEGHKFEFPPSMGRWSWQEAHDELINRTEQAAAEAAVSGQYREQLYEVIQEAAAEKDLLIHHSVIGGISTLQVYADQAQSRLEQLNEGVGPIQSTPTIDPPTAWSTILGRWLFWIALIAGVIGLGYGWHYLGRKAKDYQSSANAPSSTPKAPSSTAL